MRPLLVAWALLASAFTLVTLVRRARRPAPPGLRGAVPPVLLLRPGDRLTPRELATVATPVDWPARFDHVVLSPARPALPAGVRWLASDPATPNRKVGHLLHALATFPHGGRVVCAVDADVAVDAELLAALVAPVVAGAALVTAAPEPLPARGLGPRAVRALLCHTHQSFDALDAVSAGAKAVCGKAMALGPAAIAGLGAVRDRVGEDLELAKWLHARGAAVVLAGARAPVPQVGHAPVGPAFDRFTRWMQVLRAHRPALLPTVPLLLTPSLPLAVAALAVPTGPVVAAVGALWLLRTLLAFRLERRGCLGWPLGEALLLAAFARALVRRTVVWRGRSFRVARDGRMEPRAA